VSKRLLIVVDFSCLSYGYVFIGEEREPSFLIRWKTKHPFMQESVKFPDESEKFSAAKIKFGKLSIMLYNALVKSKNSVCKGCEYECIGCR